MKKSRWFNFVFLLGTLFSFISIEQSYCQDDCFQSKMPNSEINDYLNDLNQDSLTEYISKMESFGTRFSFAQNRKQVANWVVEKFNSFGYQTKLDSFKVVADSPYYEIWMYNVIADYPGIAWPDEILILGAHYDCKTQNNDTAIAPGADDNASGVAAMLEIARVFKKKMLAPNFTIRFIAFTMGETPIDSLCGSEYYAHLADSLDMNIKFMLECDEIANYPIGSNSSYKLWSYEGWMKNFVKFVQQVFVPDLTFNNILTSGVIYDSYKFHKHGFTALRLSEGDSNPNFHTISDTLGNCEMGFCYDMTKLICAVLLYTQDTVIGIKETSSLSDFFVYPNPSAGKIVMKYKYKNFPTNLIIYDCFGRVCKEMVLQPGTSSTFDLSELAVGIYYYQELGYPLIQQNKIAICR